LFIIFFHSLFLSESISAGESEKKAVSEPDIKPEKNNSTTITNKAITTSVVKPKKK